MHRIFTTLRSRVFALELLLSVLYVLHPSFFSPASSSPPIGAFSISFTSCVPSAEHSCVQTPRRRTDKFISDHNPLVQHETNPWPIASARWNYSRSPSHPKLCKHQLRPPASLSPSGISWPSRSTTSRARPTPTTTRIMKKLFTRSSTPFSPLGRSPA